MIENIRLAFQGIWGHKLRSVLTMLGIIIGIAAIITIVSTIKGTNEQIKENLIGAGNNVVTVQLNQGGYPYDLSWNTPPEGVRTISQETRKELEAIDGAQKVSLYTSRNYADQIFYRNTQFNGSVRGSVRDTRSLYIGVFILTGVESTYNFAYCYLLPIGILIVFFLQLRQDGQFIGLERYLTGIGHKVDDAGFVGELQFCGVLSDAVFKFTI